jgi:hypothetical protein
LPDHERQALKRELGIISTLKRALLIPNHTQRQDAFFHEHCHIYTSDQSSAALLSELLWRLTNEGSKDAYTEQKQGLRICDTIKVLNLPEGGYEVRIGTPYPRAFAQALLEVTRQHIAPDTTPKR